jgi:hypothetical protein
METVHGGPDPRCPGFFRTWKLFEVLANAAFYGRNRAYALGNTPEQRFKVTWIDSVPVRELTATNHP